MSNNRPSTHLRGQAINHFFVFCDGGARGNPGPAAIGFVVKDNWGKVLVQEGKYIGRTTNNVAEYSAVIEALEWLIKNNLQLTTPRSEPFGLGHSAELSRSQLRSSTPRLRLEEVERLGTKACSLQLNFFLDSNLAVCQLNGLYKIKNKNLQNLIIQIKKLEKKLCLPIVYRHIPRQKNYSADSLVNKALNNL